MITSSSSRGSIGDLCRELLELRQCATAGSAARLDALGELVGGLRANLQNALTHFQAAYPATNLEWLKLNDGFEALGQDAGYLLPFLAHHPQAAVRAAAASGYFLSSLPHREVVPALITLLQDQDSEVVVSCAHQALRYLNVPSDLLLPALLPLLKGEDRITALGLLSADQGSLPEVLPFLKKALKSRVPDYEIAALEVLARSTPLPDNALKLVRPHLTSAIGRIRGLAFKVCELLGPPAVTVLPELIHHVASEPMVGVRSQLISTIAAVGGGRAEVLKALQQLQNDPVYVQSVLSAYAKIGLPAKALLDAKLNTPATREYAIQALGFTKSVDGEWVATITDALQNPDQNLRRVACIAVCNQKGAPANLREQAWVSMPVALLDIAEQVTYSARLGTVRQCTDRFTAMIRDRATYSTTEVVKHIVSTSVDDRFLPLIEPLQGDSDPAIRAAAKYGSARLRRLPTYAL